MSWQVLDSHNDCQQLLDAFGGFHDSCLREVHVWTDHFVSSGLRMKVNGDLDTQARLWFQRQYEDPRAIELHFQQIVNIELTPTPENCDSVIFDASLTFSDGAFHFDAEGMVRVIARRLSWRDVSAWMGTGLRYGAQESTI